MINRYPLKCSTCSANTTTRPAIGHDTYQEFAFPCHKCGIEIRFGMTLDQANVSFEYSRIVNATSADYDPSAPVETFDGENLNPVAKGHFSPFIATVHLPEDVEKFRADQGSRFHSAMVVWPQIPPTVVHLV